MCTGSEWVVHRELAEGSLVMNERTDRFLLKGEWVDLPVAGVFELRDRQDRALARLLRPAHHHEQDGLGAVSSQDWDETSGSE